MSGRLRLSPEEAALYGPTKGVSDRDLDVCIRACRQILSAFGETQASLKDITNQIGQVRISLGEAADGINQVAAALAALEGRR